MKKAKLALLIATLSVCIVAALTAVACSSKGKLTLSQETAQLYVNESNLILRATLDPADKSAQYSWSVDNGDIVGIAPKQSACTVTPKAAGTAVVTVTVGDKTASCTVTVGADRHAQNAAPSFAYDAGTGVITITDNQNESSHVGGYELRFYDADGEVAGSVAVKNGDVVETRKIDRGDYTVRIVALGDGNLYLDSDPSEASATISVTKDAEYDLLDSKAIQDSDAAGKWGYYVGEWAIYVGGSNYDGITTFEFKNNEVTTPQYNYMVQLQYNPGTLDAGQMYKMKLNIKSPATGAIRLNDKLVYLQEGNNEITVGLISSVNNGLLKIFFSAQDGSSYILEGRFEVSILEALEATDAIKLETPSFTYDVDTKVITITDTQNNPYDVNYTLGFFKNKTDSSPMGTATVKSGEEVSFAGVVSGNYYLKLLAGTAGMPYSDSDWSEVTDYSVVVANSRVDVVNGGQGVSATNPNKWFEWHDSKGGQGSPVATTLEYAYMDDAGVFYLRYTVAGDDSSTPQPIKLHYNDADIVEGDVYELTCIVVSPMNGKITVNGQVFDVRAGEETDIRVIRRQLNKTGGDGSRTTITIQLGASVVEGDETNVYTISCKGEDDEVIIKNVAWQKVNATPLSAPSAFVFDNASKTVTSVTDGNESAKVAGYQLGLFAAADDEAPVKTLDITVNEEVDLSEVVGGTYYLKLRAIAVSLPDVDSDWTEALGTPLVIQGSADVRIDITLTGNGGAINSPNNWSKYVDTVTADYAYVDGLGDVHVKYSGTPKNDQPLKLMKMYDNINEGDTYQLSFKLIVPDGALNGVDYMAITVNGQIIEIHEGINEISVTRVQPKKATSATDPCTITLKFGYVGEGNAKVGMPAGEYTLTDITVEKVEAEG